MAEFKFYHEWHGDRYLELHDHHTIWKINKDFSLDDYADAVCLCRLEMQNHFKDLIIHQLGRSGRHICVDDTPVNRRRYRHLVAYAEKLERKIIDYFNNEYELENEE
jgi:hypothetical protein